MCDPTEFRGAFLWHCSQRRNHEWIAWWVCEWTCHSPRCDFFLEIVRDGLWVLESGLEVLARVERHSIADEADADAPQDAIDCHFHLLLRWMIAQE